MGPHQVLILDLNPVPCPADNCTRLPKLIQSLLPAAQIRLQSGNILSTEAICSVPDLILFRPPLQESVEELTRSVRRKWTQCSILALFCVGWGNPNQVCQTLLDNTDDFLFCPFKEMDACLRLHRLLRCNSTPVASSRAKAIKENLHLQSLVGESECFLGLIEKISLVAKSNAAVLISGETGTGKELFARAIHYHGSRQGKPFIPVNCGALPDHLFENELFGHAKGAFTDASSAEKGLIPEADGGTLFLDEVDTLSPSAQVKLLRFLQNGEYRFLGSSRTAIADVRVIAATNGDLVQRVKLKLFREDLYYRLNSLFLLIPPLRERMDDIGLLTMHFLARYAREKKQHVREISRPALQKLMAYTWPGNVRELESVMTRALVLSASQTLQPEDIDLPSPHSEELSQNKSLREAKANTMRVFEQSYLVNLLTTYRGNITHAAKAAGKERRSFQRLLRKHNLDRHSFRI